MKCTSSICHTCLETSARLFFSGSQQGRRDWNNLINVWHCCPPKPPGYDVFKTNSISSCFPLLASRTWLCGETDWHWILLILFAHASIDDFHCYWVCYFMLRASLACYKPKLVQPENWYQWSHHIVRHSTQCASSFNCYRTPFLLLPLTQKWVKR